MKRLLFAPLATLMLLAAACNNSATNPNASGSLPAAASPSSRASAAAGSPSASARATGSAAASASAGAVSKYVQLEIVSPKDGDRAGIDGQGWMVTILAKGHGPAMDQVHPALDFVNGVGMNQAFPGLVVLAKSAGGSGGQTKIDPNQNLAKLFQMIGLPDTGGGPVSVAGTSGGTTAGGPTGASGATGATTGSAAGTTGASSTESSDDRTVNATYYAQNARFGTDVDIELTVFVVEGDAPDTVSDRSSLRIVSNEVTVRFHINGSGQATTTGGGASSTPAPSPSGAGSPSAAPSASPSSTP